MIVRKQIAKNKDGSTRTYLLLIQSYRQHGKVKQRFVANLGRLDDPKTAFTVDNLLEKLKAFASQQRVLNLHKDLLVKDSKVYGPVLVFRRLWEAFGIHKTLLEFLSQRDYDFEVQEAIFCMVLNRLLDPESKRGTFFWKDDVYEPSWEALELQHFYRAMDFLEANKEAVEDRLAVSFLNLFNLKLDLVLMDTTTVMYDGEGNESAIFAHGYSRDKRPDLKQAVVGLLMTKEGMPLGCDIFEGNLSDRKAFPFLWERLKKRFPGIGRVIVVCDRGPVSEKNLEHLEALGYEYIVGVRMRSLEKGLTRKLLSDTGFHSVNDTLEVKEKTVVNEDGTKRRYIVAFNPEEARHEKHKREAFRKIMEAKVKKRSLKEWVIKNGYKKYVRFLEGSGLELDEKRFEEETIYDGKWVLLTNTDLSSREVALHYKGLAIVERGFRSMKSGFEVHPVYHRVDRRIRAHVFLCFLALVLKQILSKNLLELPLSKEHPVSYGDVMRDLKKLKAVQLQIPDKTLVLRTDLSGEAYRAFQAAKMPPPSRIVELKPQEGKLNVPERSSYQQLTLV